MLQAVLAYIISTSIASDTNRWKDQSLDALQRTRTELHHHRAECLSGKKLDLVYIPAVGIADIGYERIGQPC